LFIIINTEIDKLLFDRVNIGIKTLVHVIEEARETNDSLRVAAFLEKLEVVV